MPSGPLKQKYSNPSFKAPASGIVLTKRRATSESIVSIATIIFSLKFSFNVFQYSPAFYS